VLQVGFVGVVIGLCLQWLINPMLSFLNSSGSLLSLFTGVTQDATPI